jgi:hypothetical protein
MKYIKMDRFCILMKDVKSVFQDKIFQNDREYKVVKVVYLDGTSVQIPLESKKEAMKCFEIADEYLTSLENRLSSLRQ